MQSMLSKLQVTETKTEIPETNKDVSGNLMMTAY